MKKALAYFFSMLMILLLTSVLMVSCKSKIITETKSEKVVNHDSINISKLSIRNQAINDSLKILIGQIYTGRKECDSVCQIAVNQLLSQLNSKKTSGSNSVDVNYNPKDKSLNVNTKVGETKSDSIKLYYYINTTKTIYSHRDVPVKMPLGKFQLFLMISGIIGIAVIIIYVFSFFKPKLPFIPQ